jgi:hypothetical protein
MTVLDNQNRQFAQTIHSDFLIHWTGRDIDSNPNPNWNAQTASSKMPPDVVAAYVERLRSILKFGFWMTTGDDSERLKVNGSTFGKPGVARTCFTELKLSEARAHAHKFGQLGIGVKRYYVFDRLGGPMHYIQFDTENLFFPPYSSFGNDNDEVLSFFKHMCSCRPLAYDLFSESEWRIIHSEKIRERVRSRCPDRLCRFVDPKETRDRELLDFYASVKGEKPKYFLPLDGWLAIIIYPSPAVKIRARDDNAITELIRRVKATKAATGCPDYEYDMWPIEVDLAACSHF